MDKDIKNWVKSLKNIALTSNEKRAGRKTLLDFMEKKERGFLSRFSFKQRIFSGVTALVLVCSGAGISRAAGSAQPAEDPFLYTVKVDINEELHSFFLFDDQERLNWEIERMEMRLHEMEMMEEVHEHVRAELEESYAEVHEMAGRHEDEEFYEFYEDTVEEWIDDYESDELLFEIFEDEHQWFEEEEWYEDLSDRLEEELEAEWEEEIYEEEFPEEFWEEDEEWHEEEEYWEEDEIAEFVEDWIDEEYIEDDWANDEEE
jgi:hypothetical protein